MKTIALGPFLGINNRLPDFALHVPKTGDYLRSADNVDIDNKGSLHRRKVESLVAAMTGAHSLSPDANYMVRDSILYAITLPAYSETAFKTLTSNAAIAWVSEGDDLFYSNGTDSGRITGGLWYPLGLETPLAPNLSVIGGGLLAGQYQVGVTYTNTATGEESGISPCSVITLSSTGGIRVTLPGASAGATHVNIYLTDNQGSALIWLAQVAAGAATYDAIALPLGREHNGQTEYPLPVGSLFMSNGRLCSFNGKTLYVGSAWRYGYYSPLDGLIGSAGYITFPENITLAIAVDGGTYVCAGKTYWFPGDLGNVQELIRNPLPFDGVPGTAFQVPDKPVVGWFSTYGIVLADQMGQVSANMNDNIDQTPPASGVSIVSQSNGIMRVTSCGWTMNLETKAVTSYSGYGFTSAANGYGTKADGLYLLESDTTGVELDWAVGLGKQSLGTEQEKRLPAVYVGVASEDKINLRVQSPGKYGGDYSYPARSYSEEMQIQRIDPGRGLKANWFEIELFGSCDFDMAGVSFGASASIRRI